MSKKQTDKTEEATETKPKKTDKTEEATETKPKKTDQDAMTPGEKPQHCRRRCTEVGSVITGVEKFETIGKIVRHRVCNSCNQAFFTIEIELPKRD